MSKSARRLGRGLSSLVSSTALGTGSEETSREMPGKKVGETPPGNDPARVIPSEPASTGGQVIMVPIDDLYTNPHQPRDNTKTWDVTSLAASIKRSGLLQPISARMHEGIYQIIAGERRWRAAKSLGVGEIPVIVREASEQEMMELALVENIQREDLNAIERARGYKAFCDRVGINAEAVAKRLGEDRTTVVNYIRLLDLSDDIQSMVADRQLSMGHARCLLGIVDVQKREALAQSVVANGLSVRALEEIVRREKTREGQGADDKTSEETVEKSVHVQALEKRFEEATKTKVRIRESQKKGRGRIVIDYYSLDDFDRIAEKLGVRYEE